MALHTNAPGKDVMIVRVVGILPIKRLEKPIPRTRRYRNSGHIDISV